MMVVPLVFGLVIGSFLNVVIARLPEGKSLVRPRSACPTCGRTISWHDNIPIVSFLLLRARCRACGTAISWRYPAVEAGTAAAFALAYGVFGWTVELVVAAVFLSLLIAVTAIDLQRRIIPDAITLPGAAAGLVASLATGRPGWIDSLVGLVVAGSLFLVIILASGGGMGGGDMKLGAMLGAFLGWKLGLFAILIAVLAGGCVAVGLLLAGRKGRKDPIPFGPFLALGGALGMLWGDPLLTWYLSRF